MSTRNNQFLLKRSNVIDKIPPLSGLTLGELALNTADAKLYTTYTLGGSPIGVREIGWDKLSLSGGTITGALYSPQLSATSINAINIYSGTTNLLEIFKPINEAGSSSLIGTTTIDFGDENDEGLTTISATGITSTNIRGYNFIFVETNETSIDDFKLNGVSFNIENIIDNVSFDIKGIALNNASGIYTIKYLINY